MAETQQDPILREIVVRLVEALGPDRIYLFGSRARGDAKPDSDYDLLVVVESSQLPPHRRDQTAFRSLCGIGISKNVLVLTRDEFDRRCRVYASLPSTVLREGRLLYAA